MCIRDSSSGDRRCELDHGSVSVSTRRGIIPADKRRGIAGADGTGMKLTAQEIEEYISYLDGETREMCVAPDNMTFECSDCYLCRVAFFNRIREDLKDYEY